MRILFNYSFSICDTAGTWRSIETQNSKIPNATAKVSDFCWLSSFTHSSPLYPQLGISTGTSPLIHCTASPEENNLNSWQQDKTRIILLVYILCRFLLRRIYSQHTHTHIYTKWRATEFYLMIHFNEQFTYTTSSYTVICRYKCIKFSGTQYSLKKSINTGIY